MNLNALVMSRSHASIRTLVAAFVELGIEYQISPSASGTIEALATGHHSALVVDFDLPHAVHLARIARTLPGKRRPLLFGMVGAGKSVGDVLQAGANFVLYKPLDLMQVLHSFRAARGFMRGDRRRASRQKGEALAYLQLPTGIAPALVLEVSEQGLSLQAAEPLLPLRSVPLRFMLPGSTQVVHATGDFIWADGRGRAGLFFSDMAAGCRRDLQAWLKKQGAKKSESVRALLELEKPRRVLQATH